MLELQRWLYSEAGAQLKSIAGGIDLITLLTGIGLAALFGLANAFMPGHGKTVLGSYFLGRPSKVIAGLSASIILVLTHVGSAVVLVLTGFIRGWPKDQQRAVFQPVAVAIFAMSALWLGQSHRFLRNNPAFSFGITRFVSRDLGGIEIVWAR
jgi:nickel/cobalt transporter (NicO) family protein